MSIIFDENTVGVWYVAFPGKDWMAGVTREGDGFLLQYRFRYYHDPLDPWDGKDEKSWYSGTLTGAREVVIDKMREMCIVLMATGGGENLYECVRALDEPFDQFMERFKQLPFVHMRTCTEEEYRQRCGDAAAAQAVKP